MRRAPVRLVALAAAAVLAGCGGARGEIDPEISAALGQRVEAVRDAAEAGDRGVAQAELRALRDAVGTYHDEGRLDGEHVARIAEAADEVAAFLPGLASEEEQPDDATGGAATEEPEPEDDEDDEDHDDDSDDDSDEAREDDHPGRGRGRGRGRDDERG